MEQLTVKFSSYRNTALNNAPAQVKGFQGNVYGWNLINPNATAVYVKIYDDTTATVTTANITGGTAVPLLTIMVPASSSVYVPAGDTAQVNCSKAITIFASGALADTDNTALTTAMNVRLLYI